MRLGRARTRREIFDERPQMLGNRKALLAKFVSLTYRDSRGSDTLRRGADCSA
jgi:hypothetical protein